MTDESDLVGDMALADWRLEMPARDDVQATIDAARDAWKVDVKSRERAPAEALTRADIENARLAGVSKAELLADVTEILGSPDLAGRVAADLDVYGAWADG